MDEVEIVRANHNSYVAFTSGVIEGLNQEIAALREENDDHRAQIKELQHDLSYAEDINAQLNHDMDVLQDKYAKECDDYDSLEYLYGDLKEDFNELKFEFEALDEECGRLERTNADLKHKLKTLLDNDTEEEIRYQVKKVFSDIFGV